MSSRFIDYFEKAPRWQLVLLTLIGGALVPLGFAPFFIWPILIPALAVLMLVLRNRNARQALLYSFTFGLGMFGSGVSWVYVSINVFGGAPPLLAIAMTMIFVSFIALMFALPFWLHGRFFSRHPLGLLLAFPLLWFLGEWMRSWLLTGFPWLYVGYGHLDTPLAGWAPILGVSGVSLLSVFTAAALVHLVYTPARSRNAFITTTAALLIWAGGALLQQASWTQLDKEPIHVGMVQPDIAQDVKWELSYVQPTLDMLTEMTDELWENDWVIWPEAAVPLTYQQALPFLNEINNKAAETGTGLVTGIIFDDRDQQRYYNSIAGFGEAMGIYHKRRLVPFGEYVPLEHWLRGLISFFNLPTSIISAGPWEQHNLRINQTDITPAICYELAYPELLAKSAQKTRVLLSISNLGWFGKSIGPHQFMQMGQMRALETGRYLIYSTNNGSSALINHKGQIDMESEPFTRQTLSGSIYAATGQTPFMRFGHWPLVILSVFGLALLAYRK